MEVSCHEIWREISNYLDNDVDPRLRQRMEQHFAHCRHCAVAAAMIATPRTPTNASHAAV